MRKYIWILNALELMTKVIAGKRVEGVLYMDEETGRLTFKAYNRQPRDRHERVVCHLENGWLKESATRIKFYNSVKKDLGFRLVNVAMHRDLKDAMSTLEVRDLISRV